MQLQALVAGIKGQLRTSKCVVLGSPLGLSTIPPVARGLAIREAKKKAGRVREIKVSWITQESQRGTLPLPARNLPISHVPAAAAPPHALIFFLTRSGWFLTSSTTTPSSKASARGGSRRKHLNLGGSTTRATAAGAALEAWEMSPCRPSPPTSDERSRCRCRQVQDKSGRLQQTPTHGISQYWAVDGYCSSPQGAHNCDRGLSWRPRRIPAATYRYSMVVQISLWEDKKRYYTTVLATNEVYGGLFAGRQQVKRPMRDRENKNSCD
ncbi:uncharacterized protein [Lolium perenne]|uniref:uncharacterized protein n=1 Tax=Lolium perenne TaxID=4522 RepID=UPI003A9952EA